MEKYQLTNKAENEIEGIYEYSILNFGLNIAQEYVSGLHECFVTLADNQSWGNDYEFIKPGLLRYECRSHSVYYQNTEYGILVVRILGNKQDPARHL
jgi:toxin ParE1/3/4